MIKIEGKQKEAATGYSHSLCKSLRN